MPTQEHSELALITRKLMENVDNPNHHRILNGSVAIAVRVLNYDTDGDVNEEDIIHQSCLEMLSYMLAFLSAKITEEDHQKLWDASIDLAVSIYGKERTSKSGVLAWKNYCEYWEDAASSVKTRPRLYLVK
jgi:hypothetical protein